MDFVCFFGVFLATVHSMRGLSFLIRDGTYAPAIEAQSLNH